MNNKNRLHIVPNNDESNGEFEAVALHHRVMANHLNELTFMSFLRRAARIAETKQRFKIEILVKPDSINKVRRYLLKNASRNGDIFTFRGLSNNRTFTINLKQVDAKKIERCERMLAVKLPFPDEDVQTLIKTF